MQHIHFVGIKGVGMTSLAIIAKEAGMHVSGSDVGEQYITDKTLQQADIVPYVGFAAEHVNKADLVITTGAHSGFNNTEVLSAQEKGIRVVSMAEAIGMFMSGELFGRKLQGISVTGTHGKTTTTAMIATVLKKCGMDPSYFIGTSLIPSLGKSGHYGKGDYFVAEADEYATEPVFDKRPKFIWHKPKIAVITNIEHDHPDMYPDISSVKDSFSKFLLALPLDSVAIVNGDDHGVRDILKNYSGRKITYGFNPDNDVILLNTHITLEKTLFQVNAFNTHLGDFILNIPGNHNCQNALAAIIVGLEIGLPLNEIKKALTSFSGSTRRFEFKGILPTGAVIYDDYGHHPTEIQKTLTTLQTVYPDKRIVAIFQPHTYSRTKVLFDDFVRSFTHADEVIFLEIFGSARENPDPSVSSQMLAEATGKFHKDIRFLPNITDVVKYLDEIKPGPDSVIITIGAGDVYKVSDLLLKDS